MTTGWGGRLKAYCGGRSGEPGKSEGARQFWTARYGGQYDRRLWRDVDETSPPEPQSSIQGSFDGFGSGLGCREGREDAGHINSGFDNVRAEWSIVCSVHSLLKLAQGWIPSTARLQAAWQARGGTNWSPLLPQHRRSRA